MSISPDGAAARCLMVVVAGGSGTRMGAAVPKQFLPLAGRPVLMWTVELFASIPGVRVVVVLPEAHVPMWEELCRAHSFSAPHSVALGGASRHLSVANGLALWQGERLIGVHDGVRPLVSRETVSRCMEQAEEFGSAIPVMPSTESVRMLQEDGESHAVDRSKVMMVQTPQLFLADVLLKAFELPDSPLFTDEASVVEMAGDSVHLCEGNRENVKITTPPDLAFAEMLLSGRK